MKSILRSCIVLHNIVLYFSVLHSSVLHCIVVFFIVLYRFILHRILLYCIALHCIYLFYIIKLSSLFYRSRCCGIAVSVSKAEEDSYGVLSIAAAPARRGVWKEPLRCWTREERPRSITQPHRNTGRRQHRRPI